MSYGSSRLQSAVSQQYILSGHIKRKLSSSAERFVLCCADLLEAIKHMQMLPTIDWWSIRSAYYNIEADPI
eukprot:scaffold1351_cov114-Skeletonema_marinoi.AAC.3